MGERFQHRYGSLLEGVIDLCRQQGLAEGRSKGLEEGRLIEKRAILKRLLARKFGDVGLRAGARIDSATEAELERWIDRVLGADSIGAVLGG